MITINIDPTLVHWGPLMISWCGLAVATALGVGVWLTLREARRKGLATDPLLELVPWGVGGGLVGARLRQVLGRWEFYAAVPGQILALQNGGTPSASGSNE